MSQFHDIIQFVEARQVNGLVPAYMVNMFFQIFPAVKNGNCLFHSVHQLIPEFTPENLREMVWNYYQAFDINGTYEENTIRQKLQMQMMFDNDEAAGGLHQDTIRYDMVWAGIMDVIALTDILSVHIVLFHHCTNCPTDGVDGLGSAEADANGEGYLVHVYKHPNPRANVICIKYNGTNHFEPMTFKREFLRHHFPSLLSSSRRPVESLPFKPVPAVNTKIKISADTENSPSNVLVHRPPPMDDTYINNTDDTDGENAGCVGINWDA